jgi:hypothetical protein
VQDTQATGLELGDVGSGAAAAERPGSRTDIPAKRVNITRDSKTSRFMILFSLLNLVFNFDATRNLTKQALTGQLLYRNGGCGSKDDPDLSLLFRLLILTQAQKQV